MNAGISADTGLRAGNVDTTDTADDLAILDSRDARTDLPCSVKWIRPELGFDLMFHSGYQVNVPLESLRRAQGRLNIVFRVIPEGRLPVYFYDNLRLPPIDEAHRGSGCVPGTFKLGTGRYHVDWSMRDRVGRVCSVHSDITAALGPTDKLATFNVAEGQVAPSDNNTVTEVPSHERTRQDVQVQTSIIVNFAGVDTGTGQIRTSHIDTLQKIVAAVVNRAAVGTVSITAIDVLGEKVLYRGVAAGPVDMRSVAAPVSAVQFLTIGVNEFRKRSGDSDFIANVIANEVANSQPETLILISPNLGSITRGKRSALVSVLNRTNCRVYYLSLETGDKRGSASSDFIETAVKRNRGVTYTIKEPRDLLRASVDISSRLQILVRGRVHSASVVERKRGGH